MRTDEEQKRTASGPSWAVAGGIDEPAEPTPESLDRVATELHRVAERLRRATPFRSSLERASASDDERIDYLHA